MMGRNERALDAVPSGVWITLLVALLAQIAWQLAQPKPVASAAALEAPLPPAVLRVAGAGEPAVLSHLLTLYLQAYDNQPGISIPFNDLDYPRVAQWLATLLALDPAGHYPLLLAAQVYSQVPDPARQRVMLDFVHRQFLRDPDHRWRWLAHAVIMAKHRLRDDALALAYARDITRYARAAPNWAKQMQIFILEDIGELASAKILLGGLLESGEVTDEREIYFLAGRLDAIKNAEKPSSASKK
jgi:hypothetical protein